MGAAAGRAGVAFAPKDLVLRCNDFLIFEKGRPAPFDEADLTRSLGREEVTIDVRVGNGPGESTIWTCDLTDDYVRINADYRT